MSPDTRSSASLPKTTRLPFFVVAPRSVVYNWLDEAARFTPKLRVVDYSGDSTILRVYGSTEKLDALIRLLNDFTITELVRSGKMVMARGVATT